MIPSYYYKRYCSPVPFWVPEARAERRRVPRRAGLDRGILRKMMKLNEIQATFLPFVQIV